MFAVGASSKACTDVLGLSLLLSAKQVKMCRGKVNTHIDIHTHDLDRKEVVKECVDCTTKRKLCKRRVDRRTKEGHIVFNINRAVTMSLHSHRRSVYMHKPVLVPQFPGQDNLTHTYFMDA